MAPNTRVGKALRAMEDLGIPTDTVKPRLKNLLKLYNWNWDLIEEDNYHTLADAIFEYADDKRREDKEKDTMECGGSEPRSKKIHLEQPEDQNTSTMENENTTLDLEANEVPQTSIVPKLVETRSCLKDKNAESCSHSLPAAFRNKGKDPISSGLALKVTKLSSEGASSALHSKQGGDGPGFDHILKAKRHKDCPGESFVVPKRKQSVHSALPVTREGSPCVHEDNKDEAPACNSGTTLFSNFVIASSPSREVKISLNYDSAIGQPSFLAPNIDKVLKFVESKYLNSYKIVGSQFSVMKLLKDLCESYLELGSDFKDTSSIGIGRSLSGDCLPCTTGLNRKTLMIGDSGVDLIRKEGSCSEFSSSQSLAVSQKQPTSNGRKRPSRKMHDDITKGTEKVRIPLLDESGKEQLPKFNYIPENTVYQNAYIHFSLARIADDDCCSRCSRDCLSLRVPCECARDTGGEFAYTSIGLLREEFLTKCISMNEDPQKHFQIYCIDCPLERAKNGNQTQRCKGHLVRKFIKECWRRCGCDMQCGNRVVQRGITCKLQVFVTNEGKGWGLRSLQDLPKGAFVCEYVGEILTNMELYERNQQSGGNERHTYPVILDADWASERHLKDEDALCLDATFNGNVARFVNHRCSDANLLEIPVEVETPDRHYYHLAFFTKRKVDAMEELTWDYGIDFSDHSHPIKAFRCCCGSAFCRDVKERNQTSAFR